jgi:hypothetical protein
MIGRQTILRAASAIAFLQGAAHALLIARYSPRHGPAEALVVSDMRSNFFHFGGPWPHSYWELYTGYAWMAAVACIIQGAVFWIISSAPDNRGNSRLIAVFLAANLLHAILVIKFFFLTPLVPDLLIVICLCSALSLNAMRTKRAQSAARI